MQGQHLSLSRDDLLVSLEPREARFSPSVGCPEHAGAPCLSGQSTLLAALVSATPQTSQRDQALVPWKELLLRVAPQREMGTAVRMCPHPHECLDPPGTWRPTGPGPGSFQWWNMNLSESSVHSLPADGCCLLVGFACFFIRWFPELRPLVRFPQCRLTGFLFVTVAFCLLEVPQVAFHAHQPRGGARWLHPTWCRRTMEKENVVEVCGSCAVALAGLQE